MPKESYSGKRKLKSVSRKKRIIIKVNVIPKKENNKIDQDIQKKYLQLQMIKQQLSALLEEKKAIDEKSSELNMTIEALQKLQDIKKNEEIWSTLGSGTFVRSDVKDTENVLVAVGAGVVIKETIQKGVQVLSGRLDELQKFDREIVIEINRFSEQAQHLERQLEHDVQNR